MTVATNPAVTEQQQPGRQESARARGVDPIGSHSWSPS